MTKVQRRTPARKPDVGVPPGSSIAIAGALLIHEQGRTNKPYCTCSKMNDHGFGFDPQMGLYVHADPACWKPSASMYALALTSGTLEGVLEPKENNHGPHS